MRSTRHSFAEFRVQRASFVCVRPEVASNSLASAASFGTQFMSTELAGERSELCYSACDRRERRIVRRAKRASFL